jgi:hypothetical protein
MLEAALAKCKPVIAGDLETGEQGPMEAQGGAIYIDCAFRLD